MIISRAIPILLILIMNLAPIVWNMATHKLTMHPEQAVQSQLKQGESMVEGYSDDSMQMFYIENENKDDIPYAYVYTKKKPMWEQYGMGLHAFMRENTLYFYPEPSQTKDLALIDKNGAIIKPNYSKQVGNFYSHLFILNGAYTAQQIYRIAPLNEKGEPAPVPTDPLREGTVTLVLEDQSLEQAIVKTLSVADIDPNLFPLLVQMLENADKSNELDGLVYEGPARQNRRIDVNCSMGNFLKIETNELAFPFEHSVSYSFVLTGENANIVSLSDWDHTNVSLDDFLNMKHSLDYPTITPPELIELFDRLINEG